MTFLKKSPKLRKFSPGNVVNLVNHFWKVSTHTHSKIHTYTHEHTHTHTHIHTHTHTHTHTQSKKSVARPYLSMLDKTGLSVSVCQLRWHTTTFNRLFLRIGQWRPRFLRAWFR